MLGLDVTSYVSHVADNLCIWAERMTAASDGSTDPIVPYDSDALAAARRADELPLSGALWILGESVTIWRTAWRRAEGASVRLTHPDRGSITVEDIARTNAHDVRHHQWDIARALGQGS